MNDDATRASSRLDVEPSDGLEIEPSMHRFMRHLDDLAGLDMRVDTAQRRAAAMPRAAAKDWRIVAMLRAVMARRRNGGKRDAMCRGGVPRLPHHPDPASCPSRPDHVLPGSFCTR